VSGQAASLAEARGLLERVDMAVIDLGLPDGSGVDLIKELRRVSPRAQALVLSASLDRAEAARAIQAGAAAALSKAAHLDELVDALRRLRAGETLLPLAEVVELLRFAGEREQQEQEARLAIERLTPRELEVLQALAEGLDSQAVADRLVITLRTERNHVGSILAKLGVHSQLQAVVFALRHGVVELR
jgi:DNA-binding NarL/FixJ family response regulator